MTLPDQQPHTQYGVTARSKWREALPANTAVLCLPVAHDESLEAQLALEQTVDRLGVLASVGVVDLLVGAHYGAHARPDCIYERPEVELVHGLVVDVRRKCLGDVVAVADCFRNLTEMLLRDWISVRLSRNQVHSRSPCSLPM